jgi:hypothetical protein
MRIMGLAKPTRMERAEQCLERLADLHVRADMRHAKQLNWLDLA